MRRIHFSLARLMGFVLVACCVIASLRVASKLLADAILFPTLGIMAMAILGAVYRAGNRRAFWLGFALFGWGYMALSSEFWWAAAAPQTNRHELITTQILNRFDVSVR